MQPLTNPIPFPTSFPIQQAAHDPPIPDFFRRESPPSSEMGLLDPPDAAEGQARQGHGFIGSHDSVQRILVRVERDRPFRLVSLLRLPPDDQMILPRTTVREPMPHAESLQSERWHSD